MELKVSITAQDISKGKRFSSLKDPVARAVNRAFKLTNADEQTYVYANSVRVGRRVYELPREIRAWSWQFDHNIPCVPIDFILVDNTGGLIGFESAVILGDPAPFKEGEESPNVEIVTSPDKTNPVSPDVDGNRDDLTDKNMDRNYRTE